MADLVQIIDIIDDTFKMISEFTEITKFVIAKDPKALDNPLVEQIIKTHLGESMYDKIQKIYHNIIGT
jgi:hypothetical protein